MDRRNRPVLPLGRYGPSPCAVWLWPGEDFVYADPASAVVELVEPWSDPRRRPLAPQPLDDAQWDRVATELLLLARLWGAHNPDRVVVCIHHPAGAART